MECTQTGGDMAVGGHAGSGVECVGSRGRWAQPGLAHEWAVAREPDGGCAGRAVVVVLVEKVAAVSDDGGGGRKGASNQK